jgi:hypothetical protein
LTRPLPHGVQLGLDVTPSSGMVLSVSSGAGMCQGVYFAHTAASSVTISASDPLLDRYDTVVATTAETVTVVEGTAGTASDGSLLQPDTGDLVLAHVFVGAGVTSFTPDVIQDPRVWLDLALYAPSGSANPDNPVSNPAGGYLFFGNYRVT